MNLFNSLPEVKVDPTVPSGTVFFLSKRKFYGVEWDPGHPNQLIACFEPETEWLKRCTVMTNVKLEGVLK